MEWIAFLHFGPLSEKPHKHWVSFTKGLSQGPNNGFESSDKKVKILSRAQSRKNFRSEKRSIKNDLSTPVGSEDLIHIDDDDDDNDAAGTSSSYSSSSVKRIKKENDDDYESSNRILIDLTCEVRKMQDSAALDIAEKAKQNHIQKLNLKLQVLNQIDDISKEEKQKKLKKIYAELSDDGDDDGDEEEDINN